jgi:TrmH family RNA methyltransferase
MANSLLVLAKQIRRDSRSGFFLCEGVRLAEELVRSPLRSGIVGLLFDSHSQQSARASILVRRLQTSGATPCVEVSSADLGKIAETASPQGVIAISRIPDRSLTSLVLPSRSSSPYTLAVLDAVQDPGNVGTILRTAAALGADATLALPGTANLWSGKVIRSSMGAVFHHTCLACTWPEVDAFVARSRVELWAADAGGTDLATAPPRPLRLGLVFGNEGAGISAEAGVRAKLRVSIPLAAAAAESLNVGVAAGILLYQLRHTRQTD